MKEYPSSDGFMSVWYEFSRFANSDVYNSQVNIKIKRKNDTQPRMAQT